MLIRRMGSCMLSYLTTAVKVAGSKVNPNAILLWLEFFVRVPNTEADAEDGGEGLDSLMEVGKFT